MLTDPHAPRPNRAISTRWGTPRASRAALAALLVLAACTSDDGVNAPPKRLTPEFVTGAAAEALQQDGRFTFAPAVTQPRDQLTEAQARTIALHFVRVMAPYLNDSWNRYHGAAVVATALKACDRALYAATPYVSITGNTSELTRRTFGPHWVVPLCVPGGPPQVVVAFSSQATELVTTPSSAPTPWERAAITAFGVPRTAASWMYNPEQATAYVFRQTGRRVRSVPELVMSPMPISPVLVRWRVDLEGPVSVVGGQSAATRQRATLFVGFAEQFSESGLLDFSGVGTREATLNWPDLLTRDPVSAVLSPLAPTGLELVRRATP